MSVLSRPYMHDEAAAFAHVESIIWTDGPVCPHCGNCGKVYVLTGVRSKPSKKNPEGVERHGLKKCAECRKQFTVRIGTIFEESHIPLHKWLQAIHLMVSSKKGISSHQLHRVLEITHKSAWFMSHRIREAMRGDGAVNFGNGGGVVEVDETFIGTKHKKAKGARGYAHKNAMLSLVDRTTGRAKSIVVDDVTKATLLPILRENIAKEATVYTDEAKQYTGIAADFAGHDFTTHSKGEYGRGVVHTNTIEGYFSIFKRGMKGVYQHCGKKHLHRYAAEFEFRYNSRADNGVEDMERAEIALRGMVGKRLTYGRANWIS
ncbi:MAG TPA: IS1595 family transposase [Paracoccus sp. (in: a-proteobacteria)]|uniref:IS1595 family transposase n=1 Tax=uncultured Paracoccus sp. TaxID=189685 RepID=UPI0026108CD9|nr:IS1595 family transposase [uncultured Paracoccus sp.]HMQ41294.1 IS1595 family transposase [Paracoccus sp. (in: a-proteobacteria)]HMR36633.1 IS1595 family transposase [Paracoccus sp. (in: a-proteobacteria)]